MLGKAWPDGAAPYLPPLFLCFRVDKSWPYLECVVILRPSVLGCS